MFCCNHLLLTVVPTLVSSVLESPLPHPWHDTLLLTSTVLYCIWPHHSQLIETQILPILFHRCETVEREGDLHYYPNTTSLLGLGYSFVLHSLCQIKNKCKINICLIYEEIRGSQTGNEKEKSSQSHTQRPRKNTVFDLTAIIYLTFPWWCMSVIPALGDKGSLRPCWLIWGDSISTIQTPEARVLCLRYVSVSDEIGQFWIKHIFR